MGPDFAGAGPSVRESLVKTPASRALRRPSACA